MTPQMLEERLIDFAVSIVGVVEALPNSKRRRKCFENPSRAWRAVS